MLAYRSSVYIALLLALAAVSGCTHCYYPETHDSTTTKTTVVTPNE